jgi:hypothetical protein
MATVTKTVDGSVSTWRIETKYAALTVNMLFTFIKLGGEFRISENGGDTWGSWTAISYSNIRLVTAGVNLNVVVEYRNEDVQNYLLINATEFLSINNTDDLLID